MFLDGIGPGGFQSRWSLKLETVNNIPPFSVRYVTNRRDDLLWAVNDMDDPPEEGAEAP